jgi:hypothetical protein
MERIYFRTVGKLIVNFFESSVVSLLLLVCWIFGSYWVVAHATVAFFLAVLRSMWVRLQPGHPAEAAPPFGRLLMIFAGRLDGSYFVTRFMLWTELTRTKVHSELEELYKPFILIMGMNWILMRFLRLVSFDGSCQNLAPKKKRP